MLKKFLIYGLIVVFIGILLLLAICYINKFKRQYPDTKLQLLGQLDYIDTNKTEILLADILKEPLWAINIDKVKTLVYSNPWVDTVFIQKSWPNVLKIKITALHPIASWNEKSFLTVTGQVLYANKENNDKLRKLNLPNFQGKSGQEDLMINTYLLLLEKLSPLGLFISKMCLNEEQGMEAVLHNGVILKLGTFDFNERISRFVVAYEKKLQPNISDITYIDLRYTNGVAVYWETNNNLNSKDVSGI